MHCKMDVDDHFRTDPAAYRRMGCGCAVDPAPPEVSFGCRCPSCGATCQECPGFGYAEPPQRRFHHVLSRIRSQVRRRERRRGNPPCYVRVTEADIRVLLRKRLAEDPDHWIHRVIDLGPPLRIYDVITIADRRRP